MFETMKYKDGWIQISHYDGVFRVYVQLYVPHKDKDGTLWIYETKRCKKFIYTPWTDQHRRCRIKQD